MALTPSQVTLPSGLTLSYVDQGQPSEFAVVLVPGPTDSWRSYAPVLAHMPHDLRCVALSQRGHGDSAKPADGYGVADFALDLATFLRAVGVARAVLVGHSGSCLVVRRVAIDHPELVAGLVLEASPVSLVGNAGLASFVDTVVRDLADPIDPAFAAAFVGDTSAATVPSDDIAAYAAEVCKVPAQVWRAMFADLLAYDDRAELAGIQAPALLVWGDADQIVDRVMQDDLVARLPHATLAVQPGAGHAPRWEDPVRFAQDAADFARALR